MWVWVTCLLGEKDLPFWRWTAHFLTIINDILLTGNMYPTLKGFNAWSLEKEADTGSILELEGKLNIRPISLFESIIKIFERILATGYERFSLHKTFSS